MAFGEIDQQRRPFWLFVERKEDMGVDYADDISLVDFAVPTNHRIKLNECEKKDKYLDLGRELKKLWNRKVTIIPVAIGAFGTVTKDY